MPECGTISQSLNFTFFAICKTFIVFILHQLYGFMLYIYCCFCSDVTVLEFILSSTSEVLRTKHLYCRPFSVLTTEEKALEMTSESRTGRR